MIKEVEEPQEDPTDSEAEAAEAEAEAEAAGGWRAAAAANGWCAGTAASDDSAVFLQRSDFGRIAFLNDCIAS